MSGAEADAAETVDPVRNRSPAIVIAICIARNNRQFALARNRRLTFEIIGVSSVLSFLTVHFCADGPCGPKNFDAAVSACQAAILARRN